MSIKNHIVVARYNESIDWIDKLDMTKYKIYLYNKNIDHTKYDIKNLPDIGRESHTYLTYICENYDAISEFVIFLQGNPYDHLDNLYIYSDLSIEDYINKYFFDNKLFGFGKYHKDCGHLEERLSIINYIKNLFNINIQSDCSTTFSIAAQLIVPKTCIVNKPLEFWMELKRLHEEYNNIVDKDILPYVIERLWFPIFESSSL